MIWHVTYDRSEEILLGYFPCLQLLPFEITKLSHRMGNYLGNSIRVFKWHAGEVSVVIMLKLVRSAPQGYGSQASHLWNFIVFLSPHGGETLRCTTREIGFVFFTNCCFDLNIEIFLQVFVVFFFPKIAQKLFKFFTILLKINQSCSFWSNYNTQQNP